MTLDLDIRPLAGSLGAEICGLDLRAGITTEQVRAVESALDDHHVVFFREQHLSPAEHAAFGRAFGTLDAKHPPYLASLDDHPEVVELSGQEGGRADVWHTDVTISETPPLGAILSMRELPEWGGDTLFANMHLAYERLSERMQAYLEGLQAVHDIAGTVQRILRERSSVQSAPKGSRARAALADRGDDAPAAIPASFPRATHPVIRTHPRTGRKSIFVNPTFTSHIVGVPAAESDAILEFLYAHSVQPELLCRWRWSRGDVGFWDNRCTMHYAISDYGDETRVIQRVVIKGDKPY